MSNTIVRVVIYLISAGLLLGAAYIIFNLVIRSEFKSKGRLNWWVSLLQLLVFLAFFCFPYLYMPPKWAWDWLPDGTWNRMTALVMVVIGMGGAFGIMFWFGMSRAFGVKIKGIIRSGPYRYSRNPQMLGGWLAVLGVFVYEPSLYGLGWVLLWAVIGHWMVSTEEDHLRRVFGDEYIDYCAETPRYLIFRDRDTNEG